MIRETLTEPTDADEQALTDALGLVASERNKWEGRDQSTYEHWAHVYTMLASRKLRMGAIVDVLKERDQRHAEAIHLAKGLHEIGTLIVPDTPDDDTLIIDHVRELLVIVEQGRATKQRLREVDAELASILARFCPEHRGIWKSSGCVACGVIDLGEQLNQLRAHGPTILDRPVALPSRSPRELVRHPTGDDPQGERERWVEDPEALVVRLRELANKMAERAAKNFDISGQLRQIAVMLVEAADTIAELLRRLGALRAIQPQTREVSVMEAEIDARRRLQREVAALRAQLATRSSQSKSSRSGA